MGSLVRVQYRPHKNQNHLNGGSDFLLRSVPDIEPVSPRCETSTGQTKEASPQCGVPQASALSLLARNERRARSKGEQRRLSERNTGSSPVRRRSINNYPAAAGGDLSATSIGALTAISMVATPHWGACSLSIDLVLLNSSLSTLLQELVLHCWGCCGLVRLTYR